MALIVGIAAAFALADPGSVLEAVGLGGLLPKWAATVWASAVLLLCAAAALGLVRRQYDLASAAMLGVGALLAANSAVTIAVNGQGATWAAAAYGVSAIAFIDRSRLLHVPVPLPPSVSGLGEHK